ncbi:SDR family NAD(P)-dependent oxidoreductase [Micromonospora lupini]|uniref:SDR family NAD(P)-dependent oxidoreductase n=1 Tax=Micromonospora lupini TaxID=285679 RepID=UPI00340D37CF
MTAVAESPEPIAVVGMACRLPGARDVEEFWLNLVGGRDSISFFNPDQLRAAGVTEEKLSNPDYVPAAPLMPDVDMFDADLFGFTANEGEVADPQLRVFLELCHAALENAGYDAFGIEDAVGVFGTAGPNAYLYENVMTRPGGSGGYLTATLNHTDYFTTRVSYALGLRGPSMAVQTACSSSLVAAHLAAESLRSGECEMALAGGAVIELPVGHGHLWTPGGILNSDGHCRPFDAGGSGTIFGSGAGVVVLKRLSDAIAEGDNVRAVIRASAVNNDGADKVSYSAPSVSGQSAAIVEAMVLGDTGPSEVDYIEAHATGTSLGDPIELSALAEAYAALASEPLPPASIAIGSVKSNIGHLAAAAGVAALIKTVLMFEREAIAPSINVETANPLLELEKTPFEIATTLRPWPRRKDRVRVAAVSSLGVGGTNAHMILEEGPPAVVQPATDQPRALIWSARSEQALTQLGDQLAAYFGSHGEGTFADAAGTLQHGRTHHRVRAALVSSSAGDAASRLNGDRAGMIVGHARDDVHTTLLFPGQASERPAMATGLYGSVRAFSIAMDECLELFEAEGIQLFDKWLGGGALPSDPTVVQPLLFAVEHALASMWTEWGVRPDAVIGHSLGELVAATAAGVFELPDAVRVVAARAAAMAAHPCLGGMLAVAAPVEQLAELIDGVTGPVVVAAINSPRQTVVSGPASALAAFFDELKRRDVPARALPVAHAFHHPGWAAAAEQWARAFEGVKLHPPRIPMVSGRTGAPLTAEQATDPLFWTHQLLRPVRFWPAVDHLLADGERRLLLEVGPGRNLSNLARSHPALAQQRTVAVAPQEETMAGALGVAARLWVEGIPIDWAAAGQPAPLHRVSLPGYPYQRKRYWVDPVVATASAVTPTARMSAEAERDAAPATSARRESTSADRSHEPAPAVDVSATEPAATSVMQWVQQNRPAPGPASGGTAVVLLPSDEDRALTVLLAVQRAGLRVVRMRTGPAYAERAGEFTVAPQRPEDIRRALTALAEQGVHPDVLVHAAAIDPFPVPTAETVQAQLDTSFTSLMTLAQAALRHPPGRTPPRLTIITSEAVDVSGGDPTSPAKAAALGLVRTLAGEAPGMLTGLIDVGARVPLAELADELRLDEPTEVAALRGRFRWVPVERPMPLAATDRESLREQGVYLITGGFGGLGLAVARGLAGTGLRPRLVLMGRRDPTITATSAGHPSDGAVLDTIAELRALGAEVFPTAADVGDAAALRAALDAATARFGPINGLFHLAGLPGERMIAFREPADAVRVLHPKTVGTLRLEEAFARRPPLDFAVLFSSRAATDGLVGNADYAAANAFLDAMAVVSPLADGRILSIGWPVWQGPGMVSNNGPDITRLGETVARLAAGQAPADEHHPAPIAEEPTPAWTGQVSAATHWVLDEHRVARRPLMPGTAYLDLVVSVVTDRLGNPDAAVELTDVVFRSPMYDHRPRHLRVTLEPVGDDAYDFNVASCPADDTGAGWMDHVTGRVAAVDVTLTTVDIEAIRQRIEAAAPVGGGAGGGPRPFLLGPRWNNLARTWTARDEQLLRLELSPAFASDLDEHRMHPALLDTATAEIRTPEQVSYVPFMYRRLVLHRNLPARFYAHARRRPAGPDTALGDIDLVADDGTVLVRVEGFTMRRTDFGEGWDRQSVVAGPLLSEATASAAVRDVAAGLYPDDGVRLLLRLLAARVPGAVLVRPHADGRPIPLDAEVPVLAEPPSQPAKARQAPATHGAMAAPALPTTAAQAGLATASEEGAPAPRASTADRLRDLWASALGSPPASDDEDFFDAGGNSLTAIELMARIRAVFGRQWSIGLLLERRTFAALAETLAEQERD